MARKNAAPPKTNALRLLDAAGIAYETRAYPVDLDDLSAVSVAAKLGLAPERVFKTLLVRADHEYLFAVIPATAELDRKALAKLSEHRGVELVPVAELERLTGYVRGGVTVPGAKKAFRTFVHHSMAEQESISVSAGVRGLQMILRPADYLRLTEALAGAIAT